MIVLLKAGNMLEYLRSFAMNLIQYSWVGILK